MEPSLEPQNTPAARATTSMYPIAAGIVVIAVLAVGAYFLVGRDTGVARLDSAAPVQSNDTLSSSDEEAAIAADADEAYMQQLEADINADLTAIEQY